jgi:hypothetical protein
MLGPRRRASLETSTEKNKDKIEGKKAIWYILRYEWVLRGFFDLSIKKRCIYAAYTRTGVVRDKYRKK